MRGNARLDSRVSGIVRFDLDVLFDCPRWTVEDTLNLLNNIMRNHDHARPYDKSVKSAPVNMWSLVEKANIELHLHGGHLLQLSGTDPNNSEGIWWDAQPITCDMLEELLLFERDPDNIQAAL